MLTYYGINFNWAKPQFKNVDARIAACLAVDRNQLNTNILKDLDQLHWNMVALHGTVIRHTSEQ